MYNKYEIGNTSQKARCGPGVDVPVLGGKDLTRPSLSGEGLGYTASFCYSYSHLALPSVSGMRITNITTPNKDTSTKELSYRLYPILLTPQVTQH